MRGLIGVTGTNGKSTTVDFVAQLLRGAVETAGWRDDQLLTPDRPARSAKMPPGKLNRRLVEHWFDVSPDQVFVHEVFSLGLERGYYPDREYDVAAITSFDRDHLHYHATLERYLAAKLRLFRRGLKPRGVAVVQARDTRALELLAGLAADGINTVECGPSSRSIAAVTDWRRDSAGLSFDVSYRGRRLAGGTSSPSLASLWNLEVALGIAAVLGVPAHAIEPNMAGLNGLPGRLERVETPARQPHIYVDYAKTEAALTNALSSLRGLHGDVDIVLSVGGDAGKSSCLGAVATRLSKRVWITDQTPVAPGAQREARRALLRAACPTATVGGSRPDAIARAWRAANPRGCVLIAGRGDAAYLLPGRPRRVTDAEVVRELFARDSQAMKVPSKEPSSCRTHRARSSSAAPGSSGIGLAI